VKALFKPLHIGGIQLDTPLFLAPMAGQTNHAFRTLCREQGDCGMVCSELISSTAIHYKSQKTFRMFDWENDSHPFAVQLYGADPQMMAEAARIVVDSGADIVDINMGCWVPKVAKTGAGAALLRDVCTATAVVEAVVKAVSVPVTVKVRAGWDADEMTAVPFARAAEQAGVTAIAVHARTAKQGFSGQADWETIAQVKAAVKHIPVIGNGDIFTPQDAARMLEQTGCDGLMLGRGALGKPYIFRQVAHYLRTGQLLPPPDLAERAALVVRHAQLAVANSKLDEKQTCWELRSQLTQYHLGTPHAAAMRNQLMHANSLAEIEAIFSPLAQAAAQPA
jgi:tRNA-dihydrouridine synthase B